MVLTPVIYQRCFYHMSLVEALGLLVDIIPKVRTKTQRCAMFSALWPLSMDQQTYKTYIRAANSLDVYKNKLKT